MYLDVWKFSRGRGHEPGWGRGYAWLDTGTHASLLDAGNFVRTLEQRQGQQVGSPEEVAFKLGWIDGERLAARARMYAKTDYGAYLAGLAGQSGPRS